MIEQGSTGGLNATEKKVVKYLVEEGWTNQNIQALINLERPASVNFGRIAGVKSDEEIKPSSKEEFYEYQNFKRSFDLKTGLNPYVHERLIKSREAMKLAVSVFNNPTFQFRAENFAMLANVAWTYLILEFSDKNGLPLKRKNGKSISLSDFIDSEGCTFSEGTKKNLRALVKIRNETEHRVLGPFDQSWVRVFQANCLNYEKQISKLFGERMSLSNEISFALQFSSFSVGQAAELASSEVSDEIRSINAEIFGGMSEVQMDDLEFQFAVVHTTVESSKSKAAFQFVSPTSLEGKEIANVLVKHKPSAITHPYKPDQVVKLVMKKSGKPFNLHQHTTKWKQHAVRPNGKSENPEKTDLDYCYYNPTFKSYTYNDAWADLLIKDLG